MSPGLQECKGLTKGGAATGAHGAKTKEPRNPRKAQTAKVKRAAQRQGRTSAPVCCEQKAARGVSETPKAPAFEVHARIDGGRLPGTSTRPHPDPLAHTLKISNKCGKVPKCVVSRSTDVLKCQRSFCRVAEAPTAYWGSPVASCPVPSCLSFVFGGPA